jgi:hypothetical protein
MHLPGPIASPRGPGQRPGCKAKVLALATHLCPSPSVARVSQSSERQGRPKAERSGSFTCRATLLDPTDGGRTARLTHEPRTKSCLTKKVTRAVSSALTNSESVFRKKPLYTFDSAPLDQYTDDFPEISSQVRAANNWTCGSCGIPLISAQLRRYLHVHHENGQKGDNRSENLKVRCLRCHAEEPDHARMTYTNEYKSLDLTRFGGHRDKPVEDRRRSVQWQENRPRTQQKASDSASHPSTNSKQFASARMARSRSRRWRPIWESRQTSCIGGAGSMRIAAWPPFPAAARSTRTMRNYIAYGATSVK